MDDEGMLGEIRLWAANFAPKNWMFCEGQELVIQDESRNIHNEALYAILGTTYGGDGKKTFKLPDLRGRSPIGTMGDTKAEDNFPLTKVKLGEKKGEETTTLAIEQLPMHNHQVRSYYSNQPGAIDPDGAVPANVGQPIYGTNRSGQMGKAVTEKTGGGQPHENMQPSLATHFIICVKGYFPSRN